MVRGDTRLVVVLMAWVGLAAFLTPLADGLDLVRPAVASSPDGSSSGSDDGSDGPSVIVATSAAEAACDAPNSVKFDLEICNTGLTDLVDVVVTDTLPVGMVFTDGTITPIGAHLCDSGSVGVGDECPCEGGVTLLEMQYTGVDNAAVTFQGDSGVNFPPGTSFPAVLNAGDTFVLQGGKPNGKFESNNLIFSVNGVDTAIHVSCSKPIGVGFVFGPFTVLSFASRNGGSFDAPCEPPPPACPCEGGLTFLSLEFNGDAATEITVDGAVEGTIVVSPADWPSGLIELNGSRADGRFRRNNLVLTANGQDTTIHVSCSKPIGIGSVFGPFTVVAFSSRDGGTYAAPCDGTEGGSSSEGNHGGDNRDPCKGQKIKICFDVPIPPGECVTISYAASFSSVLCRRVEVKGKTADAADVDETVKVKTRTESCLDDLLGEALACLCVSPPPPVAGACCFDDGSCSDLTQVDCNVNGGWFGGEGTSCATAACVQPGGDGGFDVVGFCGLPPGVCDVVALEQCLTAFEDSLYEPTGPIGRFWSETCAGCCQDPANVPCDLWWCSGG